MRLADLLSNMIAGGADIAAVSAVVEAARREESAQDQRRRELTAARVAKHRAGKAAASTGANVIVVEFSRPGDRV